MKLNLSPAETIFIISGGEVYLKSFYKYTFLDLLLQAVLRIEISNKNNQQYVVVGPNFGRQYPRKHEIAFLSPYLKTRNIKIPFAALAKMVVEKSDHSIEKNIFESEDVKPYFKQSLIYRLLGMYRLNEQGKHYKTEILTYLGKCSVEIPYLLKNNPSLAFNLFDNLNGNIHLLKNWSLSEINKLDERYLQELRNKRPYKEYTDFTWLQFPDELFITYDDSSDSGCSSCSSCNSCSGCGGCGGCS